MTDTTEYERGLIADILYTPPEALAYIREAGLTEKHFYNDTYRKAFKAMIDCGSQDRVKLMTKAREAGWSERDPLEFSADTILDISTRIREIISARDKDALASDVQRIIHDQSHYSDAASMASALADKVREHSESASSATSPALSLADLPDPVREEDNPYALFRNGWLRKGGGVVLTAQSGVGKSVIVMQMSYAWSIGRPCFGIEPLRPLKIGIIQFEDDADEMAGFRSSMRKGYRLAGWTDADIDVAERNIHWEMGAFLGKAGDSFCARLREVQRKRKYDLVIVNPLQSCFGADISKNAAVSHFFREGIDPVIKDTEHGCGIMFVHHTNKPPKDANGNRVGMDAASPYEGAGGAEIVNWERAALNIVRCEKAEGFFLLVAAKRGDRLLWKDDEGGRTKRKVIAHSEGVMFWREPTGDEIPAGVLPVPKITADPKTDATELAEWCREKPSLATDLREHSRSEFGKRRGDRAYDALLHNTGRYGIVTRQDPSSRRIAFGSAAGCEQLLKYLNTLKKGDRQ